MKYPLKFKFFFKKVLYEYKKNFTLNLKLDNNALEVCKNDLANNEKLKECKSVDSENGHLTACLIDNKDDVNEEMCKTFLTNVAALVFSDYHLINNFVQDCEADIKKFECGRLEKDTQALPTEQGKTIECLSLKFQDLEDKCKKQIVRVTELQSDDFHLDRVLYFACREDRERFCERISSGNGRVYKCLMKQKFNELMSKECQKELTRRQKIIVEDYKSDRSLVIACKSDILKSGCRKELRANASEPMQMAGIILCLESTIRDGNPVEANCKSELIEHRKMLLSDYQLNPNVVKYCQNEINTVCNGLERNGKTLNCLMKKMIGEKKKETQDSAFNARCFQELKALIKVADAGEDARVDEELMDSCQNLIQGPCKGTQFGEGRMITCLIKFIGSNVINDECEERLLEIQFFVARDWKLTPKLYGACKNDAIKFCHAKQSWSDSTTDVDNDPLVLPCLFHKLHEDDPNEKVRK